MTPMVPLREYGDRIRLIDGSGGAGGGYGITPIDDVVVEYYYYAGIEVNEAVDISAFDNITPSDNIVIGY